MAREGDDRTPQKHTQGLAPTSTDPPSPFPLTVGRSFVTNGTQIEVALKKRQARFLRRAAATRGGRGRRRNSSSSSDESTHTHSCSALTHTTTTASSLCEGEERTLHCRSNSQLSLAYPPPPLSTRVPLPLLRLFVSVRSASSDDDEESAHSSPRTSAHQQHGQPATAFMRTQGFFSCCSSRHCRDFIIAPLRRPASPLTPVELSSMIIRAVVRLLLLYVCVCFDSFRCPACSALLLSLLPSSRRSASSPPLSSFPLARCRAAVAVALPHANRSAATIPTPAALRRSARAATPFTARRRRLQ